MNQESSECKHDDTENPCGHVEREMGEKPEAFDFRIILDGIEYPLEGISLHPASGYVEARPRSIIPEPALGTGYRLEYKIEGEWRLLPHGILTVQYGPPRRVDL